MLFEKSIVQTDMEDILSRKYIPYDKLRNRTILITGAGGMLAYYFTCFLMYLNEQHGFNIRVLALVRNKEKAEERFGRFIETEFFELLAQDVCEEIHVEGPVGYILHAAGNASPYFIKNDPIGIIHANIDGTRNVLEFALNNPVENVLYTSTREIYGKTEGLSWITEEDMGSIDPLDARSCYPESKRMAEQLFKSYQVSYGLPFTVVRIAHSYGPGMTLGNDGRVMSDFITCVAEGKNIVLKSNGEAIRAFCYITDAVAAMFCVLLKGEKGQAYNVANETEPYAIRDVAQMLIDISRKPLKLTYDTNADQSGYCNYERVGLATDKLESLGWNPVVSLSDGLSRTLASLEVK